LIHFECLRQRRRFGDIAAKVIQIRANKKVIKEHKKKAVQKKKTNYIMTLQLMTSDFDVVSVSASSANLNIFFGAETHKEFSNDY